MAKKGSGMLNMGWPWFVTLILTIIPFTHWVLGAVTRFMRGNILGGILNIIPIVGQIFWVIDLITVIIKKDLVVLA
ncbi:MAG: hypothetical protein J6C97_01115 [Clostridia bacterium]|nr:hypothetical protein [Clostridia bacterium]